MNTIDSKEKQDTYLYGLIKVKQIVRRRQKTGNGPNRTCSCIYKLRVDVKEINVCKKAFCSLLGIGKSRVERLLRKMKSNEFSPVF